MTNGLNIQGGQLGADAKSIMLFEANKKSVGVAYALWFFFGLLGGHRFYSSKIMTAVMQLLLTIVGLFFTLVAAPLGWLILFSVAVWVIIDAFLIPRWIRKHNNLLARQLGA
jgi:TM2 domain-containing membrane protein YozV